MTIKPRSVFQGYLKIAIVSMSKNVLRNDSFYVTPGHQNEIVYALSARLETVVWLQHRHINKQTVHLT